MKHCHVNGPYESPNCAMVKQCKSGEEEKKLLFEDRHLGKTLDLGGQKSVVTVQTRLKANLNNNKNSKWILKIRWS